MYLEKYLSILKKESQKKSVQEISEQFIQQIKQHFDFKTNISGLLLGNVQSGKTSQMLGAISRMADEGYKIFIILTSDNVDLQRQTYNRVKASLTEFDVLSEKDDILYLNNGLRKPVVFVLKKNGRVLGTWKNLLVSNSFCKGQFLTIFDDEADNASLNTLVNRNKTSPINKNLQAIRNSASSSIYIEVTATPQALLLQSSISDWRPGFVVYFKPGEGYLGGDFFYSDPKPFSILFTPENELDDVTADDDNFCPVGLQKSIIYFLIECAHKKLVGESNCNFMIHPSVRTSVHAKFANRIEEHLNLLQRSTEDQAFSDCLKEAWLDLRGSSPNIEDFDDIQEEVVNILDSMQLAVYTLNSKSTNGRDPNNPDALNLEEGFNIVVGGNTLGRGITFPHLQVVYYCRSAKTPQADTFWQHSRIFGYDREGGLVRIFIPQSLYKLFTELNKANGIIIKQIVENGLDGIELIYPTNVKPTRKNVLDNLYLNVISGGVNFFPNYPIEDNVATIDPLVEKFKDQDICVTDEDTLLEILNHAGSELPSDFDSKKFQDCITALVQKRPKLKFRIIVRYNRDISKGTGTLLSPTDRLLGDQYKGDVVLTLYRVKGQSEKGWKGKPFWIPNIKFPHDSSFYNAD